MTEITDKSGGAIAIETRRPLPRREDVGGRWAPPVAWVAIALLVGLYVPAWAWMWILAVAVFAACKWATWWPYRFDATQRRSAAFLFAYAGMDAESFILGPPVPSPRAGEWLATTVRIIIGVALIWIVARILRPTSASAAGWAAMVGLVLLLHFGLLDMLALAWRARGVNAQPLMRQPTRAKSVADFWGKRWNTGFSALAHDLLFEPLRRSIGVTSATAAVFFGSGAIHDLVISVPARGGYGGPTLYFLIQFAGLLIERTKTLRRTFARHPLFGRAFAIGFIVAPLPLLFHERFVNHVILPFLTAIGGLS